MSKMIPQPDGFEKPPANKLDKAKATKKQDNGVKLEELKLKKAWETAYAPAKSIPMNAFMLWMSGSGVQIFSIIITVMLLYQPIKAIASINQIFDPFKSSKQSLLMPMLAFSALQICVLGLGIWKCSSMGLLPTSGSDWLAFLERKEQLEYGYLAF